MSELPRVEGATRDPALVRLYAATFLYTFAQAVGLPLLPEFLSLDLGASVQLIGAVVGLYGLMQIFLRLPMGDMADRRGRKPSLYLAFAATFGAGLFFVLGPTVAWIVPGVALFGLGGGVFWVAANAYLFDRVGSGDAAKATSDYSLALGVAFLVGPPLGHFVAEGWGFRAAFATFLATSALAALLVWTLPETPPAPREPPAGSSYARAWRLLRHPALVLSAIGVFLYSSLFSTMNSFLQLHALSLGISITVIGLLLGGRQASATVVRVGLPRVLKRFGAARILVVGLVVFIGATALVPVAQDLVGLAVVIAIAGAATGVLIPANLMLVHEGSPPGERGLANGIYGTMLGFGSAIAPPAYGAVGERFGLDWAFWAAALVALALLVALGLVRARRDVGRAPATPDDRAP